MTEPRVTYRRSPINEWTRPAFRRLSADAKLVLLAARTGPSSNMVGLAYCPAAMLAAYTGLSVERVAAAERELTPDFLERDPDTDELFVADGLEHQVGDRLKPGDKRIPHILGLLVATHSDVLRARWAQVHPGIAPQSIIHPSPTEGASEGAPQAPSKPVAVAVAVAGAGAAEGAAPGACAVAGKDLDAAIQPPEEAGAGLVAPPASPAGGEPEGPDGAPHEWVARIVQEAAELGITLEPARVYLALQDVVNAWRPAEISKAMQGWAANLREPGTAFGFRSYLSRRGHLSQHHGEAA
jgi:hypothetical protein